MDFYTRYAAYQAAIEQYLEGLFSTDKPYGRLQEAMRYSLLGGGKRIRPVLTLEMARLGGIDWHLALPYACALELVHTYSLIHDDLPCMDDDDLRRGKPTCHKAYGETLAVLAGDALQPEAFRLIAEAPCMSAESRVEAIRVLSHAAGADGMVAGQVIDTLCGVSTQQELTGMYRLKTGVMISAAAELGCVASGMPAAMRQQAIAFADKLSLSDPGRYAGCGGRRGCVRQAHRFRSRGGKGHLRGRAGAGGLPHGRRGVYPPGRGGHPPVAGSRLPVDAGSLAGGEKEVRDR